MRIVRAGWRTFRVPLRRPLATAHGAIHERRGLLVSLEDELGHVGQGEAAPLVDLGTEDEAACRMAIEAALSAWVDARSADEAAGRAMPDSRTPCARAALDGALADLAARRAGQALAAWLRARAGLAGAPAEQVAVQALVSGEKPEAVAASARAARSEGFGAFKLKLAVEPGRVDLGRDLERVAALREAAGPAARLRLDANEAFDRVQARAACRAFAVHRIDLLEQPLARDDVEGLAALTREGLVPIAADEALSGTGLEACLAARAADVFVVKPAAAGGASTAIGIARRAAEVSIEIVWSSLIETEVGLGTALALAAALAPSATGSAACVQGLGTADWLACGLGGRVSGPRPVAGRLAVPSTPGLGLSLAPAWSIEGEVFEGEARVYGSGA
ncbi:MAG: o-succinylbenzoate synthase [Spirochaetaceae bacterium]|nr:o-succinylbenzoate synthase [Spirochaetaceae bacterium]